MKTKIKKISTYQKAIDRMERETNRAIAQVERLEKIYLEKIGRKTNGSKGL